MDEATSSVDIRTDKLIQTILGSETGGLFQESTIITIAHRLNTIIEYDEIMVLEQGQIVEKGTPFDLISKDPANPDAWFSRMTSELGKEVKQSLQEQAKRGQVLRGK